MSHCTHVYAHLYTPYAHLCTYACIRACCAIHTQMVHCHFGSQCTKTSLLLRDFPARPQPAARRGCHHRHATSFGPRPTRWSVAALAHFEKTVTSTYDTVHNPYLQMFATSDTAQRSLIGLLSSQGGGWCLALRTHWVCVCF